MDSELGQTTRSFFDALKEQPLSLALCVMNFILLGYLFYTGSTINSQRNETVHAVIQWQKETDTLMANCVSKEVLESVVSALQRQMEALHQRLNDHQLPVPSP